MLVSITIGFPFAPSVADNFDRAVCTGRYRSRSAAEQKSLKAITQTCCAQKDAVGSPFTYATISQLILAYSARRIVTVPQPNLVLHLTVLACVALQLLTLFVPGLRWVLGIELIDPYALTWVAGAMLLSWGAAEIYGRVAIASDWLRKKHKRIDLDDKIGEVSWK